MKYILIFLFIFILTGCYDKSKYDFIYNVLNDPDNLERYIYEADFDISQYKRNFLTDGEKKIRDINYLKTLKSKYFSQKLYDYTVNEDVIYNINCDDEKKDSVLILHRIVLEGDSNCLLKFSWFKSNDKWVFIAFSRTYPGGFD